MFRVYGAGGVWLAFVPGAARCDGRSALWRFDEAVYAGVQVAPWGGAGARS
jgi:hypothetical protein